MACVVFLSAFATPLPARADAELDARRARVEQMIPAERQELLRKQERFASLAPEEQERIRKLSESIERDPRGEQMRATLKRYHQWLLTLSATQRSDLLDSDSSPRERIDQIKKIKREQAHQRERMLAELTDQQAIVVWLQAMAAKNQDRILASLPPDERERLRKESQRRRTWYMLRTMMQHWHELKPEDTPVEPDDIALLRSKLSPSSQARLASARDLADQRKIIRELIYAAVRTQRESAGSDRGLAQLVPQEELERFFKSLPEEKRDALLAMPREQFERELRSEYWQGVMLRGRGSAVGPGRQGSGRPGMGPGGRGYSREEFRRPRGPGDGPPREDGDPPRFDGPRPADGPDGRRPGENSRPGPPFNRRPPVGPDGPPPGGEGPPRDRPPDGGEKRD